MKILEALRENLKAIERACNNLFSFALQANKDAARYPVAAKVAELLMRGLVSAVICLHLWLYHNILVLSSCHSAIVILCSYFTQS